jgi:hypothetical protein
VTLEQRLSEALHSADEFQPSPDLFARVGRSVEEDRAHRRRLTRNIVASIASLIALAVVTGLTVSVAATGRLVIPAWVLESVETVVMIVLVLVIGPSIRRFGRSYVDDVFAITEGTGQRILRLLDIAYYLVFAGLILTSAELANLTLDVDFGAGMEDALVRIGRMLVVMGALHAVTILTLPLIGFVYSSLVWMDYRYGLGPNPPPPSPGAAQAARIMKIILIVLAVIVALNLVSLIPALVGGLLDP